MEYYYYDIYGNVKGSGHIERKFDNYGKIIEQIDTGYDGTMITQYEYDNYGREIKSISTKNGEIIERREFTYLE